MIVILKPKLVANRTEDGGVNPNAPCISHLPSRLQNRSQGRKFELKTNSNGQFAIWWVQSPLCTLILKLYNWHHLPEMQSHPLLCSKPLQSCPQTASISALAWTLKQSKASTQVKLQLFSLWEVSFSIHHISELDHYANVCINCRKKMAEGQKQTARAWKGQNHFFPQAVLMFASIKQMWVTTA